MKKINYNFFLFFCYKN